MIKIFEQNGRTFVWDSEEAHKLRSKHRIVGSLAGCYPKLPFQNCQKYLPLLLMPEESTLAADKGFAEILSDLNVEKTPDPEIKEEYWKRRKNLCDEQIVKLKESRVKMILDKADVILEGKKRKSEQSCDTTKKASRLDSGERQNNPQEEEASEDANDGAPDSSASVHNLNPSSAGASKVSSDDTSLDSSKESSLASDQQPSSEIDSVISQEIAKVPNLKENNCLVQLFTACPWKNEGNMTSKNWHYPRTLHEKLRYAVFKDLWEKGYHLTAGTKFGGDFLAYAGDPIKFHALFIVLCIDHNQDLQSTDIIIYGRLGNQVKKTVVLASMAPNSSSLCYLSLKWAPDIH